MLYSKLFALAAATLAFAAPTPQLAVSTDVNITVPEILAAGINLSLPAVRRQLAGFNITDIITQGITAAIAAQSASGSTSSTTSLLSRHLAGFNITDIITQGITAAVAAQSASGSTGSTSSLSTSSLSLPAVRRQLESLNITEIIAAGIAARSSSGANGSTTSFSLPAARDTSLCGNSLFARGLRPLMRFL